MKTHTQVRTSYILLIAGGALIAAGLAVSTFSVSTIVRQFPKDAFEPEHITLGPGQAFVHEAANVPAGRQYIVSISAEPADVPLVAQVRDGDGTIIQSYNVTSLPFSATFAAPRPGSLSLEVRNVSSDRQASVAAGLLGLPFEERELVNFGIAILAGAALVIAGIGTAIAGGVKLARERRSGSPPPPPTAA